MALGLHLRVIAIADHDSTDGVAEAQESARDTSLEVVPAVEINVDYGRLELHILGYYLDPTSAELQVALAQLRAGRQDRARQMVERLAHLGLPLSWERVAAIAGEGTAIGRPHVAQALLECGYVGSIQEAFTSYIGHGGPAYVERFKLSPAEAISLVRRARGVPVLAHPLTLMDVVPQLVRQGLAGIEVYYTGYTDEERALLLAVATKYGLLVTGGSDFHGYEIAPNNILGGVRVPRACLTTLLQRHRELTPARA